MDGSYGGRSDDHNNDMEYDSNEKVMTVLIQRDSDKSSITTWPLETTIAVEGNHWVH